MMPRVETIKIIKIKLPATCVRIELAFEDFWKLRDRFHLQVFEGPENFYLIYGRGDVIYYAKRRAV